MVALKILRTMLGSDDDGQILICDTIEHEGGLWLVPEWRINKTQRWRTPIRIILIDQLRHQRMRGSLSHRKADFLLTDTMPKSVLDGPSHSSGGVELELGESPDIHFPLQPLQ